MSLAARLNSLPTSAARSELAKCCAADAWIEGMLARRPFASNEAVLLAAAEIWNGLAEADWLEAFAAHPLIGDVESLRQREAAARTMAAGEQAGVAAASDAVLHELAELNRAYLARFGFIFIVFATGKNADEMLAILRRRINNTREEELKNAAAEHLKITELRLQKLASRPGDA